jgi:RNA polymerase sigma factor (sigma-70 family)
MGGMDASAVAGRPPAGVSSILSPKVLRLASDAHLVALIRQGRMAAFEAAYQRHHRAIHSFCRHMLGQREEAEDVVQDAFLAAYNDIVSSEKPIQLRPWLFTVARNRCYSILRGRREHPAPELEEAVTDGLAAQSQRRQDVRDLLRDMGHLPDDQRSALVLAELDALSHEEIAEVLGIPRHKVKALVFQARESLLASREARETDCAEIRAQLSVLRGGGLRRSHLRRHLRECRGCAEFRREVEHHRRRLAVALPVAAWRSGTPSLPRWGEASPRGSAAGSSRS